MLLVLLLASHIIPGIGQTTTERTITGVVMEATGEPIPGATIFAPKSAKGVISKVDGTFSISVHSDEATLSITYIGMSTVILELSPSRSHYEITLYEDVAKLDEVVVTGYQTISKERSTGSFAIVGQDDIQKKLDTSLLGRLEGSIAGLQSRRGGEMKIRGVTSLLGSSQPLIVVDGMPMEGDLSSINPATIEKVTVLKDAAAASIYGARAANGVIIVSTISGSQKEGFTVTYDGMMKVTEKPSFDYLDLLSSSQLIDLSEYVMQLPQFASLTWSQLQGSRTALPYFLKVYTQHTEGTLSDAAYQAEMSRMRSYENSDDIRSALLRTGLSQMHNLTMVQSGKRNRLIASINYEGNRPTDVLSDDRSIGYSLRNLTQFTDRLSADLTVAGHFSRSHSDDGSPDALGLLLSIPSYTPIFGEDGSYLSLPTERSESSKADLIAKGLESEEYNPLRDRALQWTSREGHYTRINTKLSYKILEGLTLDGQFQLEKGSNYRKSLAEETSYAVRQMRNSATIMEGEGYRSLIPKGGQLREVRGGSTSYTGRLQANYDTTFGSDHRITALAGTEWRRIHSTTTSSLLMGYDDTSLGSVPYDADRLSNLSGTQALSGRFSLDNSSYNYVSDHDDRFVSLYANFAYDYLDRYNFTGSIRIDQSNLFGTDPKIQYRPLWSLGASWAMHREDFMREVSWINRLTPRLTYGIGGNIPKVGGPYMIVQTGIYGELTGLSGSRIQTPPNPSLTWERTATLNLGLDFALFGNRLSGYIDVYNKATDNLLGTRSTDPTLGWANLLMNYGSMNNRGVELTLHSLNVQEAGFRWSSDLTLAYNRNRILDVDEPSKSVTGYIFSSNGVQTSGYPVGSLFALRWAGLYTRDEEGNKIELGRPHVFTGEGETQSVVETQEMDDLIHMGTMTPSWNGGLTNTLEYKGLSLAFTMVYYGGHVLRDAVAPYMQASSFLTSGINTNAGLVHAWRKEGDEELPETTPMLSLGYPSQGEMASWYGADLHVFRGDYIRLRDVVVSYSLPAQISRSLSLTDLTIRLQANNLWYHAFNDRGIDPEAYSFSIGRPGRVLQSPATYTIGLSITL